MDFEQSPHEAAVYRRGNGGNVLLVDVYVNDLVITGTKDAEVAAFKDQHQGPPPLRLRRSGLFNCLVISSAETLERWNSEWTASPLWPWPRTPFSMNGASTSG
jgi:hypothetical protein